MENEARPTIVFLSESSFDPLAERVPKRASERVLRIRRPSWWICAVTAIDYRLIEPGRGLPAALLALGLAGTVA
jgi:hypothetical protein